MLRVENDGSGRSGQGHHTSLETWNSWSCGWLTSSREQIIRHVGRNDTSLVHAWRLRQRQCLINTVSNMTLMQTQKMAPDPFSAFALVTIEKINLTSTLTQMKTLLVNGPLNESNAKIQESARFYLFLPCICEALAQKNLPRSNTRPFTWWK